VDGVAEIVQALCFDKQPFFGDVRKKVDVVIVATPATETATFATISDNTR
jgi:hypothetical protein